MRVLRLRLLRGGGCVGGLRAVGALSLCLDVVGSVREEIPDLAWDTFWSMEVNCWGGLFVEDVLLLYPDDAGYLLLLDLA